MGTRSNSHNHTQTLKRANNKKRLLLAALGVLGSVSIAMNIWLVSARLFESQDKTSKVQDQVITQPLHQSRSQSETTTAPNSLPRPQVAAPREPASPQSAPSHKDNAVISSELALHSDDNTLVFPLPIVMEKPVFDASPSARANAKAPDLELLSTSQGSRASQTLWLEQMGTRLPICGSSIDAASSIEACPPIIPRTYQGQPLVRGQFSSKDAYFFYGPDAKIGRYLIVMDRDLKQIRAAFDFGSYLIGPQTKPGVEDLITQSLLWAARENDTLFIANAHSSYSENSGGKNAYLTAIDLHTRKILWRSMPRVANASTFEIIGDTIVSGYGFTKEPDYLYMIDKTTGGVVNRVLLKTGPENVLRGSGQRLLVTTYDTNYVFKIR